MQTQLSGNPYFGVQCTTPGDINRLVIHVFLPCCLGQNCSMPSVTSQVNEELLHLHTDDSSGASPLFISHGVMQPFMWGSICTCSCCAFFYSSDFSSLNGNVVQDKNKIFFNLQTEFAHDFQTGCSSGSSESSTAPELFCGGGEFDFKRFSETFLNLC